MIVDFSRKQQRGYHHINIDGALVASVGSFRYLCVHITEDLTRPVHTGSLVRKAHQCLYDLRGLAAPSNTKKLVLLDSMQPSVQTK